MSTNVVMEDPARALEEGHALFMGLELEVARGALVPRAETELLARTALAHLASVGDAHPRVIDMCCGVGNLAVTIAASVPGARVWASDLTDACVQTARRNVMRHALAGRVTVVQGDLFEGLKGEGLEGTVDLIVCNPPYISTSKLAGDRAELLAHEPREAFDAGPYGLAIHQRVVREALPFLRPSGVVMFELGAGQGRQVKVLLERARVYRDVKLVADSNGVERVAVGYT